MTNNDIEIKENIENKAYSGAVRRKVLIVEDVELNRDILRMILSEEYDVLTAENGEIGLELLAKHYRELSIVLLDMHMPVCDGFEFLRRSRADVLLSSVPVMVTTGFAPYICQSVQTDAYKRGCCREIFTDSERSGNTV